MHILFACPHHDPDAWVPLLEAAMPGCRISVWNPEGPPSGADVALAVAQWGDGYGWGVEARIFIGG